jgi:hypothetical protein
LFRSFGFIATSLGGMKRKDINNRRIKLSIPACSFINFSSFSRCWIGGEFGSDGKGEGRNSEGVGFFELKKS